MPKPRNTTTWIGPVTTTTGRWDSDGKFIMTREIDRSGSRPVPACLAAHLHQHDTP